MKVVLKHPQTGEMKQVPVGFSWTMLLFGFFVPLIRGDFKWAVLTLIISSVTGGLAWLVFPFIYNKLYIKDLIKKGFKVQQVIDGDIETLKQKLNMDVPTIQ